MHDDLDLRIIDRRHDPDPKFVADLEVELEAIFAGPTATTSPSSSRTAGEPELVEVEAAAQLYAHARRRRRARGVVAGLAAAACVVAFPLIASRRDGSQMPLGPVGSPQNGWVAFPSHDSNGGSDVVVVRDGTQARPVGGADAETFSQECGSFSPDGRQLVYGQAAGHEDAGFTDTELVIADVQADGSTAVRTTVPVADAKRPPCGVWSSDGRWIAFSLGDSDATEVRVFDTASGDVHLVPGVVAHDFEWRPGTDELALSTDDGIVILSSTSGVVRPIDAAYAREIAWSPNGTTIALVRPSGYEHVRQWLIDADGTNERPLTPEYGAIHGIGPVWSPDGSRVAYQRLCESRPLPLTQAEVEAGRRPTPYICREQHEVVLVTVDDTNPNQPAGTEVVIPPPQTPGPEGPHYWYPFSVTWSPDSSTLLYVGWDEYADQPPGTAGIDGVVAVPVDPSKPPILLAAMNTGLSRPWATQSWGREPPR